MYSKKLHHYDFHLDTLNMVKNILVDSMRTKLMGIPKIQEEILVDMARKVLLENIKGGKILHAGVGHYKYMWVADLGVAFKGLSIVADQEILKSILEHILNLAKQDGEVYSCYSLTKGSNIPYFRADSLPWFIYCLTEYIKNTNDLDFLNDNKALIQKLINEYEFTCLDNNGLVKSSITGDWMDTILRPSSTWNNLCLLKMLYGAKELGLKTKANPLNVEVKLLKTRLKKDYLVDYFDSSNLSVDGAVLALYFGLFSKHIRLKLAGKIEELKIHEPISMRPSIIDYPNKFKPLLSKLTANGFHQNEYWLHLGLMFLNGLAEINKSSETKRKKIEKIVKKYANFMETVNQKGEPINSILSSEYGFSMSAGQYSEFVSNE